MQEWQLFPPFAKGDTGGFPMLPYNKNLKEHSRQLRKDMTEAEKLFWSKVRNKQLNGVQFYRQKIIGDYIVDFYCPQVMLVIEIDGSQHYQEEGLEKDEVRDAYIRALELTILRFTNREVLTNMAGVLETVHDYLQTNPPQSPFSKGGGIGNVS